MNTLNEILHPDFKRILDNFVKQYGKEKGTEYYYAWVNKHKLDDTKPYNNQAQLGECFGALCESFRWLDEPLIKYYKSDDTGKYYKCVALTANVSMNMNDYSDQKEFQQAAGTLTWRPLNINHDHNRFLPFPDNRVDYAVYEDNRAETIIRIDNKQREIQRKIENGEILHPSIEGNPRHVEFTKTGRKPSKWNFTALALLERDVTLPGDPLTYLEPLPLNESMGRSLVESLSVEKEEENMSKQTVNEQHEGINGMDVCSQCRSFTDLSDTVTTTPKATGAQDDAKITTASGSIGPGVGVCEVATKLTGVKKYVRKNDPACTDGRVRDTPTDVDRIKEEITLDEIEQIAMVSEYKRKIADREGRILEEITKTNEERESKLKALKEIADRDITLKDKQREIATLTSEKTRLTEEVKELRDTVDHLREEMSGLKVKMDTKDTDIKHYKDRHDVYDLTHKELNNEAVMLKERLNDAVSKRDEALEKSASDRQRAINTEQDKARIQEEYAQVMEQLSKVSREVSDVAQIRNDQAKQQLRSTQEVISLRGKVEEQINVIRDLKQKLSKQPIRFKVKG